jgi:uncharacterized protein with PhoU and TrkA domain
MRYPSVNTLMQIADGSREDARKVRQILEMETVEEIAEASRAADSFVRACFNTPKRGRVKLEAIDEIIRTCGVEYQSKGRTLRSPAFSYLNAGDTYTVTLVLVNGRYRVTTIGDILEHGNYE